jgi:hypothetical protein
MIHPDFRNDLLRQHTRQLEAGARRAQRLAPDPKPERLSSKTWRATRSQLSLVTRSFVGQ